MTACVGGSDVPGATVPPTGTASAEVLPVPGRTIAAAPTDIGDLNGYRIAVVIPDTSDASERLLAAAREVASSAGADLVELPADLTGADPVGAALEEALAADADLVVGLGDGVIGVFDIETGKALDQQVLVIGGQLAEPTENVTAVIWPGATAREASDDAAVTVERGVDALAAGIASIREGVSGVVLSLD